MGLLLRTKRAKAGAAVSSKGMRRLQLCGTTDIGRPGWRSYQVLAALIGTDVLPLDQVWVARRSMQHGPAIANQAPHRHRQAKSGTCRGREPPHARHTFEVLPPETRPHKIDLSE